MPRPRSIVTVAGIEDAAEKLLAVGTQLAQVAVQMKEASMKEALLPWTNAHWRAVDKIVECGIPMLAATQTEISAFKGGRKSSAALEQERSIRDYVKRKERIAQERLANPPAPKRPRGRPRLNP